MHRLVIMLSFFLLSGFNLSAQVASDSLIFKPEDKVLAENKLQEFAKDANLPISELMIEIGKSFLDTPYSSASLENGKEEKLVVNLRELDCTTFVESVLALSRCIKAGKKDFDSFVSELQKIRYRNGKRHGYPSRLHYFSEWISNNQKKGIVDGTVNRNGKRADKTINYMSTHSVAYPVLKEHPELIPQIAKHEKELSKQKFWYFPKPDFINLYKNLKNGDIVALTSTIDGIDVNHVGIIIKKADEFYLLHASQSGKKVVISDSLITDFLKPASKNNGIMIARPVY